MGKMCNRYIRSVQYSVKMKVGLLGIEGHFSKDFGYGIERYMYELYHSMREIENRDFSISKVELKKLPIIGSGLSFDFISRYKNFSEFDILHNLMPLKFSKPKKLRKNVLITTAHDFQPILYPELMFENKPRFKDKLWLDLVINPGLKSILESDYISVNSTQTKEEAIKLGFDKSRIFVINLGIDKRFMQPIKAKKSKNKFIVGYIGAMRKRKNLEFGIKAANIIKNNDIIFDIWGKKEFEYEYLASISKNKNINFGGFAPEKNLINIYNSFGAFIFPSYHEGEGLPILEAQSRGLPVIIYKYGKIPKEVRKYCFEAESPEHMAQIIEDLEENGYNEKLQKEATVYARSFTWEKTAKETLEAYKRVLK